MHEIIKCIHWMRWECQMLVLTRLTSISWFFKSIWFSRHQRSSRSDGQQSDCGQYFQHVHLIHLNDLKVRRSSYEWMQMRLDLSICVWVNSYTCHTLLHWCASKMRRLVKCVVLYSILRHASSAVTPHPPGLFIRDTVQSGCTSLPATSGRCVTFGAVFGVGVLHCQGGGRQWALLRQRPFSLRPLCKHIKKCLITAYTAAHPMTLSTPQRGQKGHPESGPRLMCAPMQIGFMHMRRN